jgi:hypothetical protein
MMGADSSEAVPRALLRQRDAIAIVVGTLSAGAASGGRPHVPQAAFVATAMKPAIGAPASRRNSTGSSAHVAKPACTHADSTARRECA